MFAAILLGGTLAAFSGQGVNPLCDPPFIKTTNRQKEGASFLDAAAFLRRFVSQIDPGERGAFMRQSPQGAVADLLGDSALGVTNGARPSTSFLMVAVVTAVGRSDTIVHAFVDGCGSDLPPGEASLILNVEGGFFRSTNDVDGFRGGSDGARQFILLHEFCHLLGCPDFQSDGRKQDAVRRNDDVVRKLFPKTLLALRKR